MGFKDMPVPTQANKDIIGTEDINPQTGLTQGEKLRKTSFATYEEPSNLSLPDSQVTRGYTPPSYQRILGEEGYYPSFGPGYVAEQLHANQTATGAIANSIGRFALEVASTAMQTFAYDSDLTLGTDLAEKSQQEFGNELSRFAESIQQFGRDKMPIYVDPFKVGKFDPGSVSWWGENALSIGSSFGMMIPSMLMGAATGGVATGLGLKALGTSKAFTGVAGALWSRHAENLMEASGVYKQAFDEAKAKNMSDEDAKAMASLAASNTYKKQWLLLVQDIPQYILMNKFASGVVGKLSGKTAAMEEAALTKGLLPKVEKYLGYGNLATRAKKVGAVAKDIIGEAGEEMYQFAVNEQSNLMARDAADPNHNVKHSMMDVIKANYDNGEMWTAGFWGGLGAGVVQASTYGVNASMYKALGDAQLETVKSLGPTLKQAYEEYDKALSSGDPLLAESARPGFVASLAMKGVKTNTVGAMKNMIKALREGKPGESFEKWGVDAATQGRLKEDPSYADDILKGIDRVEELYKKHAENNKKNKSIPEKEKEPKAQAMAHTEFLQEQTTKHLENLKKASETAWEKVKEVEKLSPHGQEDLKIQKGIEAVNKSIKYFEDRLEETKDTATESEKKQIGLAVAQNKYKLAKLQNALIDHIGGTKEETGEDGKVTKVKVKDPRTKEEKENDNGIVVDQAALNEYIKQEQRISAAESSLTQLNEDMKELHTAKPLSETIADQLKKDLGVGEKKQDKIDAESNIKLEDKVVFENTETKEPVEGKIVGVVDETDDPTKEVSYLVEKKDGEIVTKPESTISKVEDPNAEETSDVFDSLSETDENLLGVKNETISQEEDEEDGDTIKTKLANINKLSYTQYDETSRSFKTRNIALTDALNDPSTSLKGAQVFYQLDRNDAYVKEVLKSLVETGNYTMTEKKEGTKGPYLKETLRIVVNPQQQKILKKFTNGIELTNKEILTLLDEGTDNSYNSFIDGFPVAISMNLASKTYEGGLFLHGSKFVPMSSIPVKVKTAGKTAEERKKSIDAYRKAEYAKNREVRRDLLSVLLQNKGKVYSSGITISGGKPNNVSKAINPKDRNQNLEKAFGIPAENIKLAISKSSSVTPELTTLYLNKNNPLMTSYGSMLGQGSIYALLTGARLNKDNGLIKLNKGEIPREMAGLILDAFFLVASVKVSSARAKEIHSHKIKFSKEILERNGVSKLTGIRAGELIDLFVVNGENATEPRNRRFTRRYGKNPAMMEIMQDKRLYLSIEGRTVILAYGHNPETNSPYTIDLNQRGVPGDVTDLSRMREHFIDWMVKNKRYASYLHDKTMGSSMLNLDGDFLDDRTINIEFNTGTKISRKKGETYSTFLIKNNLVVTDVVPVELPEGKKGGLFRDPVVNMNLVDPKTGRIKVHSKAPVLEKVTETTNKKNPEEVVTQDDLKDKKDAEHSQTVEEKDEQKPVQKKTPAPYKNRFIEKKDRTMLNNETLEPVSEDKQSSILSQVDKLIEAAVKNKRTAADTLVDVEEFLEKNKVVFGKGSKPNQNIIGYIKDRFSNKTNRTLLDEFNAAITPSTDKKSATSTESSGTPVEPAPNAVDTEEQDQAEETGRPMTLEELISRANNEEYDEEPPFAREQGEEDYESYTNETRESEIKWAFEALGIDEKEWQLKKRIEELFYKGKKNFALYSHAAILLYEAAEIGTIYHEAFHRVSLGYLTKEERSKFYRYARLAYNIDKNATDRQVEELLAEKFRSFMLSEGKKQAPNSVQQFFDWILEGIKSLFYGKRRLSEQEINTLFQQIKNGAYKENKILGENLDILKDDLYARAVVRGTDFNTLDTRRDFDSIIAGLAKTLLNKSKVEDLNDVEQIDPNLLVKHMEEMRDNAKKIAEYVDTTEQDRKVAQHMYEMYDELLGEFNEETKRYVNFATVIKPAVDNYFLDLGIKQNGVSEDEFTGDENEDEQQMISRLGGGDYLRASYERNRKDTALPNIKFMIATLSKESSLVEDKKTGRLRRVSKINPVTMLYDPVDFNKVWSKLYHSIHHLDSIEQMIDELKLIAETEKYSPFAELAEKLQRASTNTRIQFFTTFSCAEHEFINTSYKRSKRAGLMFFLNKSAEQSAKNDSVRTWTNNFFNNPDVVYTATVYEAKRDKKGNIVTDKEGNILPNKKGKRFYAKKFEVKFFDDQLSKLENLKNDLFDAIKGKSRNYEGKLVKFIPKVIEILENFGIRVDESTIREVIRDINGETIENDMDRLTAWVELSLTKIVDSDAYEAAIKGSRADRKTHGFFSNPHVMKLAEAHIKSHPELKADIQIGPGDGDTSKKHKWSVFAADSHATRVTTWIKHRAGYVEERLKNNWTRRSKILRSMTPYDLSSTEEAEQVQQRKDSFNLLTFSYLKEQVADDKGRGYLNMTEREDYLVKFNNVMREGLLPFPIMAQRKTYFYMSGVERFRNAITGYDAKTKNMTFSKEVTDYFWDVYMDENERANDAVALIELYKKTKDPIEKKKIQKNLVEFYHYTGNYNVAEANATQLIKFRGFPRITSKDGFDIAAKTAFVEQLTTMLNKRIVKELDYARSLGLVTFDSTTDSYEPGLINQSSIGTYESEREDDTDFGVRATLGEYTLNYMMSIIEVERIYMGDPAFFEKNANSGEVVEALYKRYYGLGSTGDSYAETLPDDMDDSYTASTIKTQKFESIYYGDLLKIHTQLWEAHYEEKDPGNKENATKAADIAKSNLRGYLKVDATDGGAIISPSMYKKMLKRSGAFNGKVQYAFELLTSGKQLSKEEEIKALNIVLNPQKTVYFGNHNTNGIDRTVYDKMSMSVLFPTLVKGTHMQEVLDRMELSGNYANATDEEGVPLKKIDVLNYDSAVKTGKTTFSELYTDKQARDMLVDLRTMPTEDRYWRNLRRQQSTDAHAVASKQMVGTQVYKIISANILTDLPYGNYSSGREMLNSLTKSRIAVSNTGRHRVEATLGIKNGQVSNQSLIELLRKDALQAKKSDDFRSALRLDKKGQMYLELDAFPDRNWVYSRLINLVNKNTIDLNLPGSQLIQVSDYGYSGKGLQGAEVELKSELKFYSAEFDENDKLKENTRLIAMECRVPVRAFRRLIPNYERLTHDERVALLPKNLQILGYRIPTQGQNSVVNLTVVDFLPDQAGEVIHLPLEFTTLTGSDFDIDKLFTMMRNYKIVNGKLVAYEFTTDSSEEAVKARYDEKLKELYKIYKNDGTLFDDATRESLRAVRKEVKGDLHAEFAQDDIIRDNLIDSIAVNKEALKKATDEEAKKAIEAIIKSEEKYLEEINERNFAEEFIEDVWVKKRSIIASTLMAAGKIGSLKQFSFLPLEEQNTSEANENRIFDIFQTILSDLKHARSTTLPLSTQTDDLKERARRYTKARKGGKTVLLEALESDTPSFQSEMKFKFMTSTKGIGVFALQNSNHALTQQANIKMRTSFYYGKGINHDGVVDLDRIEGLDSRYITDWLSTMLDAHVDAIKDNYIAELNVNAATYSATSLLLRLGFGLKTFDFLAQPAIVELAKAYYNLGGGRHVISDMEEYESGTTMDKAYRYVKERILRQLNREVDKPEDLNINLKEEKLFISFDKLMADDKLLLEGLDPNKNKEHDHVVRQLNFLEAFMAMATDSNKLNELVLATRVDTKAFGSNPVEFRHFMNKIVALEETDKKPENRTFVNLDRLINSNGEYVLNGTMLPTLLSNSIFYLEKIFGTKSIVGSVGFGKMFWSLINGMVDSERFRMSVVNDMSNDLFSVIVSRFFGDPANGIGMTKGRLEKLFLAPEVSVFDTLAKIKSPRFKHHNELKDNKILTLLQIDSKPNTAIENFITLPFLGSSNMWETDDYIADFKQLIEHTDEEVQALGRLLYLYAFYSTGYRRRYYEFYRYLPTSSNKEIKMMNSTTKEYNNVSYNDFIKNTLEILNDPGAMEELFSQTKKDFFENNWYNWRYVPRVTELIDEHEPLRDDKGFIQYVAIPFGRRSKYALGLNEDGDTLYPSYISAVGGMDIAQYLVPRPGEDVSEVNSLDKLEDSTNNEETDLIGGNVALFHFVGVFETIGENDEVVENAVYVPINKKGALSNGIVTTEAGIKSVESFIPSNNLIQQKSIEERIKVIESNNPNFKVIPFRKQTVVTKITRGQIDLETEQYMDELDELREAASPETTKKAPSKTYITYTVSKNKDYPSRTKENATSSDITTALAYKFNSLGEELTAESAQNAGKIYIPFGPEMFAENSETRLMLAKEIVAKIHSLNKDKVRLNIAGNSARTLRDNGMTQREADTIMIEVLGYIKEHMNPNIKLSIVTGGQTGFDEAGAKSAIFHGFPVEIHAPKDWKFRPLVGKDIVNDPKLFMARFNNFIKEYKIKERETNLVNASVKDIFNTQQSDIDKGKEIEEKEC